MLLPVVLLAGCGGDETGESRDGSRGTSFEAAVAGARSVEADGFPRSRGRTLDQLAKRLPAVEAALATSAFTPGENRLGFGVIDKAGSFVYGKTAVYLARSPKSPAVGPFPAPADPLVVEPPFRSRGAVEGTDHISAIYAANVDLPAPGRWSVLVMTKNGGKTFGAATEVRVARSSPIPAVGELAPRVATDTLASAGGDIEAIETRVPADEMHETSFDDVAGKKPVALLFATPRLCQSRVCGPVVDIAAQLQKRYGDRVEFIHQEVYVDNEVDKGLRPPLRAFRLQTEPWLFTVDRKGRVAARLEGSFGTEAFDRAVKAAL